MSKFIAIVRGDGTYIINSEEVQVIDCIDKDLKFVIVFKAGSASTLNLVYYATHEYNKLKEFLFSRLCNA